MLFAYLSIETLDVSESSRAVGDELGDNGDLLGGIDGLSRAVEGGVAHTVGVEVTSVVVTNTVVSVGAGLSAIAGGAVASVETCLQS